MQPDVVHRASAATNPIGFFNRPSGLPFGRHLQRRAAQQCVLIRFRRAALYLPRQKSNAGHIGCEKCGLDEKGRAEALPEPS
jgi:hypothetical protein